jgi:hypothetical protein
VKINCCGRNCEKCDIFGVDCQGCYNYRDKEPTDFEDNMCPIYECAMRKYTIRMCSQCPELPCHLFDVCVNKKMSKREIETDKIERVKLLKSLT